MSHQTVVGHAEPTEDAVWDSTPGGYFIEESGSGETAPARIIYMCPCGCGQAIALPIIRGDKKERYWKWDGNRELPTLEPSIRRLDGCKWHGFLQNGVWNPCGDSGQ